MSEAWWSIDWENRDWLPMPCEMKRLKAVAEQPGNYRSRKPARLVYLYALGHSREVILADLRISEATIARYFQHWIDYGVSGVCGAVCEPSLEEYVQDCDALDSEAKCIPEPERCP